MSREVSKKLGLCLGGSCGHGQTAAGVLGEGESGNIDELNKLIGIVSNMNQVI